MSLRGIVVRLHRYAGLATAAFLFVAGLTGSLLAFYHEIDQALNPRWFRTAGGAAPIPPLELIRRVESRDPRVRVTWLPLDHEPGHSVELGVVPRLDPATGKPYHLDFDEIFVDPADGRILGRREWGSCCLAPERLMPFLYTVHYSLYIPGKGGVWLMGLVALLWTFDCFLGFYLTLPARAKSLSSGLPPGRNGHPSAGGKRERSFLQRWAPAWRIKRGTGTRRLNFDLHRAGGLWFWGLLLALAVSGVSFNLREEVFEPVVAFFSPLTPSPFESLEERPPGQPLEPGVSFAAVLERAEAEAAARGLRTPASGISYNPSRGAFGVRFGRDHSPGLGNPWLFFDGRSGEPLGARIPGTGSAGDLFRQLQYPLHSGQVAGLPGRILICLSGLAVAMLSLTGVAIWLDKRRGRRSITLRRRNRGGEAADMARPPQPLSADPGPTGH